MNAPGREFFHAPAPALYVVVCADGRTHGTERDAVWAFADEVRAHFFIGDVARLDWWTSLKCGPHRVARFVEERPRRPADRTPALQAGDAGSSPAGGTTKTRQPETQGEPNMKFRKKPIVIEAWQWSFSTADKEPPTWVTDALNTWPRAGGLAFEPDHPDGPRMVVATLEGEMTAQLGDWIVRGIKGELYPVKPDIFEATYEPVP